MKKTIVLLAALLLFSYCKWSDKPSTAERFIVKLQFFKIPDKKLITQADSTNIYYRGDLIVYEKPFHYLFLNYTTHIKSDVTTVDTLTNELRYRYLVSDRSGPLGTSFDSLTVKTYKRVSVDSFKNNDFLIKLGLHNPEYNVLVSSTAGKDPDSFVEKYICKNKPDESYFDTACYYFSRKSTLRYSMDPEFEKIKKAKLYKEVLIYSRVWNAAVHDTVPQREFSLELKEIPENNRVQQIMEKYLAIKNSDSKKQ